MIVKHGSMQTGLKKLDAAIRLHEKHMTTPTSVSTPSQRKLMELMQGAKSKLAMMPKISRMKGM